MNRYQFEVLAFLGKNGKNVSDLKSKKEEYGGKKTPDQIMEYINEYLPEDIAVLSCEVAPERFHSRLSAVRKTYCWKWDRKKMFFREIIIMVWENGWMFLP